MEKYQVTLGNENLYVNFENSLVNFDYGYVKKLDTSSWESVFLLVHVGCNSHIIECLIFWNIKFKFVISFTVLSVRNYGRRNLMSLDCK